jgi:hypothetical protein
MASALSDILHLVDCLRESARRGDWKSAGELAAILPRQELPENLEELGEYLRCLQRALIVARVSRAHAAASLARLNAVARFNEMRLDSAPPRQEFGESAES